MEVVASLSQGRTAAAQCGLFTHKSVPVIFEPPCVKISRAHMKVFHLAEKHSAYEMHISAPFGETRPTIV